MQVKELIREIRLRCLVSQKELADWLHTDQTSVSSYECGKRQCSLKTLRKIIEVANTKAEMNIKYSDVEVEI